MTADDHERLRNKVLGALQPQTRFEGFVDRVAGFLDLPTQRVRELLATIDSVPKSPWQSSRLPGIYLLHFSGGPRVATADCGLVHIDPGTTFPAHHHLGDEWAFILHGQAKEDSGQAFLPGDIVHKPAGSEHAFEVTEHEPCIFAVVLHVGLEWNETQKNR